MMTSHVGVIRDGEHLAEAVRSFAAIERDAGNIALRNMATTALLVAASAWARRESRGAQYRTDYPAERPELRHRTMTTLAAAREIAASLADHAAVRAPQPISSLKWKHDIVTTPASLLHPDAFLSPLAIDEAVQRALDEDLGRAGDITSMATIPETARARAILVARQAGVIAGLPLAVATFQKLSPDLHIQAHFRDGASGRRRRAGADDFGPGARGAGRRAHRAEFRRPAVRHRHPHLRLCPPYRRHQNAHLLHPQDHARACARWKNMPCAAAAASITASGSTMRS